MRPLAPSVKTALFFYAGLVILVWLFHYRNLNSLPGSPVLSQSGRPGLVKERAVARAGVLDLVQPDNRMNDRWSEALVESGYPSGSFTQGIHTTLFTRTHHYQIIKWVGSQHRLVLPPIARPVKTAFRRETPLIHLGAVWKGLSQSAGLIPLHERWGSSRLALWVKLTSGLCVKLSGVNLVIPVQQITIIQPFNHSSKEAALFTGWLPRPRPPIPLELMPLELIPEKLGDINRERPALLAGPAKVAIIIDDIGYENGPADEMLKLPVKLTWSILPFAPYGPIYLKAAQTHGFQVMLHLPLEPVGRRPNPGPGTVRGDWTQSRILAQLSADLETVPGAVGVNNHMGSAGTGNGRLMGILMRELKHRRLFFVDSMTAAGSVAGKYAGIFRVPFAKRRVFIDNEPDPESKQAALRELIRLALKDGAAIGIAHPRPGNAQIIAGMLPEFSKAGVEIVPVSELVR